MKKIITFLFLVFILKSNAQSDLYTKIKNQLKSEHSEINLENKLIAVNVWEASNSESRQANKEFEKVFSVYEYAKLKGGLNGIICIGINIKSELVEVIYNKDGIIKLIDMKDMSINNFSNIVFDSNGNTIYTNLASQDIFKTINQLITR